MSKESKWRKKNGKKVIKMFCEQANHRVSYNNVTIRHVSKQPKDTKGVVKWLNEQLSAT